MQNPGPFALRLEGWEDRSIWGFAACLAAGFMPEVAPGGIRTADPARPGRHRNPSIDVFTAVARSELA